MSFVQLDPLTIPLLVYELLVRSDTMVLAYFSCLEQKLFQPDSAEQTVLEATMTEIQCKPPFKVPCFVNGREVHLSAHTIAPVLLLNTVAAHDGI